jgi:hypothetical protein
MRGRNGVEIDWSDRGKKLALMEDTVNDMR